MTTSTSPQPTTTAFWRNNSAGVVSAVALLASESGLQSITITKLGTSGGFSVSSVTSVSLGRELLKSLSVPPPTLAIPLPGEHWAGM